MIKKEFGIVFGILCDGITEQIEKQGFKYKTERDKHRIELLYKSYNMVRINGIFTDSECERARKRFMKHIESSIEIVEGD